MFKLTKVKNNVNEILKTGTIKECIYYLCSLEDNIYHALAHKGYNIFDNEEKIANIPYELKEEIEKQYKKDLYFQRVNKINKIIKSFGFIAEKEWQQIEKNNFFYPDNINIYAIDKENNKICFSMVYNNKGKVTISPVRKRDKENNFLHGITSFSISFSLDKDITKIKKDIEKRFFPEWKTMLQKEIEVLNSYNKSIDSTLQNLEILKGENLTDREKQEKTIYPSNNSIYKIRVFENYVYIELRGGLTIDEAKKVLQIVK